MARRQAVIKILAEAAAAFIVDNEQIAARAVNEIQAQIGAQLVLFAIVLHERIEKEARIES